MSSFWRKPAGSPKFRRTPFNIIPRSQTPEEEPASGSLQCEFCCLPANEHCRPSSNINISGLNPFTLAHCGLILPAGGFTYFVTSINAPYGYRLTCLSLSVPDFNRLKYASFAWRTHFIFDSTILPARVAFAKPGYPVKILILPVVLDISP